MRFPIALLTLLLPAALAAQTLQEDGPFVLWEGAKAQVLRIHQGRLERSALGADHLLALEGLPALRLDLAPPAPAEAILPAPARIAAVSDIHGNFPGVVALLRAQGILDANRRWTFGQGHLVVVGDTFDRGAGVTECFWLLRSLEAQARAAGGRVHVLLGNHEVRALKGDTLYLNPKYDALAALTGRTQGALYGPDTEQGRWLRSRNVVMRLGDLLFVHAGLTPELAKALPDLAAINARFRKDLDVPGMTAMLGKDGPSFYRGLIPGKAKSDASDADVAAVLAAFQARAFVVGHSTLRQVTAFHGGLVFGIDADLQNNKPGELWLWDQGKDWRGLADGTRIPL